MLQVPSTSQNQLLDQYDDMIQFHDGKWDVEREALCHVFQMFTVIQLRQVYTLRARFINMRPNTSCRWKPHLHYFV